MTLLVTGATGSVGSNVVAQALAAGQHVRALVRAEADAARLTALGAEAVRGDVTDPASLAAAADGVSGVVHCAAQIGGSWSTATAQDFEDVNQCGTINVLDAARTAGAERVVVVLSAIVCDPTETVTERSRLVPIVDGGSAYVRTKLAAYYEGMARAARGDGIRFVVPAGIYGPTPFPERALVPTIFTGTLLRAWRGEITRYLPNPISWVLAADVAAVCLAALDRGRRGARYLAMGRPEDTSSLPAFCNAFLAAVGSQRRVTEFDPRAEDAAADAEFGGMRALVRDSYPEPPFDNAVTTAELGVAMTSLADGLEQTAAWLQELGMISSADAPVPR